ncbi:helix-turn-helix domain-containing protein [Chitinophaga rhizophila]|uniref:AraC family transcriptional regulator n=1 Tax=Chitinophaga rhizophila TaxID=2866212 RepID=A0ABS7GJG6_9BACT|nr:AraC family transcriptional regulator [Chitinophaga rhizophila]MBW8687864.1 AraC family transcriptional regulator [Chitinophaga rhizophila]
MSANKQAKQISYSCYHTRTKEGEQFVAEHVFSYQLAGTLTMNDGEREYVFRENEFRFSRRNTLMKFTKQPPAGGDYKNISVFLDQETLRRFGEAYGYSAEKAAAGPPFITLQPHALLKSYMDSLQPYDQFLQAGNEVLLSLKVQEAIAILLQTNPQLKDILFDLSEPGKIDLEGFMNSNFHFNVPLDRFAYLTGRSLSTFKRDFERTFSTPPGKWLQQKRLQEAYYRIKEKGAAPSDVYLDVGFEDLSHFSFAFKKMYGAAPSKI